MHGCDISATLQGGLNPGAYGEGVTRMTYIVSRDRPDLFAEFQQRFADSPEVTVLFDRRVGDRRRVRTRTPDDRRRVERRQYNAELRLLGWTMIRDRRTTGIPLSA